MILICFDGSVDSGAAIDRAVLGVAEECDAEVVVLGTRGLSGVKSMMLGSISQADVHHADGPALIVPLPALVAQRRNWVCARRRRQRRPDGAEQHPRRPAPDIAHDRLS
jgi:hypothetical protein